MSSKWHANRSETESQFSIYPNPANDVIYINGNNTAFDYYIYNNIGQQVANGSARGSQTIDVSGLTRGLYIVRMNDANGNVVVKKTVIR